MKSENLFLYKYQVRTFNFHRQEILEDLIQLKSKLDPDIVFMPALDDLHQDHATIAQEGLRAFKMKTIFCYEMIWNNISFNTSCFFTLTEGQLERKMILLSVTQVNQFKDNLRLAIFNTIFFISPKNPYIYYQNTPHELYNSIHLKIYKEYSSSSFCSICCFKL